jgi:hypothetical protein
MLCNWHPWMPAGLARKYSRMHKPSTVFVIPTYRLRDVGATVEAYDQHFRKNGHAIDIVVFDDSSVVNQQKYFPLLEQTTTFNPLYYVGPQEKERFLALLFARLRDPKLEPLIRNLFRPSYGGNRNCTLIYTLGDLMISSDDDMRPFALIEDSPETLGDGVVCRGMLKRQGQNGYTQKSFDILGAFQDVLGKPVRDVPANHERGELLIDSAVDLETNASTGLHRENSLQLRAGKVDDNAVVKMAQTFRSGTNDIDALDFVQMYLDDDEQVKIDELNEFYVLDNFRPAITKLNWRMDCGVAGYDNTLGLPPFFPTRLRFEDYIYRLWIQQPGIAAAHVDAAQNHIKNNYMRDPLPAEVFNEEVANLLKRKIKGSLSRVDELSIAFDYEGEITLSDSESILERVGALHRRVVAAQKKSTRARKDSLKSFAVSLERAFFGFDPDFFQQKLLYLVDEVISQFKGSLEIWPTLVEVCYLRRNRAELPRLRVANKSAA